MGTAIVIALWFSYFVNYVILARISTLILRSSGVNPRFWNLDHFSSDSIPGQHNSDLRPKLSTFVDNYQNY
jgi:hypothetical protein